MNLNFNTNFRFFSELSGGGDRLGGRKLSLQCIGRNTLMRVMSAAAAAVLEGGHVQVLVPDFHLSDLLRVILPTTAYQSQCQ